ncbi:MAG: hypothetical protein E6R04_01920 [Spirochaetes bacterium]|nr:MAG: hypothetical protein E6R04_01920 [Spirochaetota bacterium]
MIESKTLMSKEVVVREVERLKAEIRTTAECHMAAMEVLRKRPGCELEVESTERVHGATMIALKERLERIEGILLWR